MITTEKADIQTPIATPISGLGVGHGRHSQRRRGLAHKVLMQYWSERSSAFACALLSRSVGAWRMTLVAGALPAAMRNFCSQSA
jgi:hypothetical protein